MQYTENDILMIAVEANRLKWQELAEMISMQAVTERGCDLSKLTIDKIDVRCVMQAIGEYNADQEKSATTDQDKRRDPGSNIHTEAQENRTENG